MYVPYHLTSCSAYKLGQRRKIRGKFGEMVFVFPCNHCKWWAPAALFVCAAFALLIKLSVSQHEFSNYSIPSSTPLVGDWVSSCFVLGYWTGFNHDSILLFLFLFLDLTFYCLISLFLCPFLFPNKQSINSNFTVSVSKFGLSSAGT